MEGDKAAAEMLLSWKVIFETLKVQEISHAKNKGDASRLPSAEPLGSLQPEETASLSAQPSNPSAPPLATKKGEGPLMIRKGFLLLATTQMTARRREILLTLDLLILKRSQTYTHLIQMTTGFHLKQQVLREGELDIAARIAAPVIYSET